MAYYDDFYYYDYGDGSGYDPLTVTSGSGDYNFDLGSYEDIVAGSPDEYFGFGYGDETVTSTPPWWSRLGSGVQSALARAFTKPDGGVDWRSVATVGGGLMGLMGVGRSQQQPTGYKGEIPKYTAVRERVGGAYDPERRPGSGGQRFFSDTRFAKAGEEEAARAAAQAEAAGLASLNAENPARQTRPAARAEEAAVDQVAEAENRPASDVIKDLPVPKYAAGGIAGLKTGKYLSGATDGMADKIPANIEGTQPAALSHGEFVIPADVVSHLGNGNSDAGAKKLYEMMAKIRQARTGTKKQGKEINPNKYLPV